MSPTIVEDRLVLQKEAAKVLGISTAHLRRLTSVPRVAVPTGRGRIRKVRYKYRLSTLYALMAEWEEKPNMEQAS